MKIRLILDTNLWISYLISKKLARIDKLFDDDEVVLLFSEQLLEEFIEVANRPKFRKYFLVDDLEELLALFGVYGELVDVTSQVEVCRDPKDNFLLALAKDGQADYLLSGDLDLLELSIFENTEIITYSEFESKRFGS
jgi:putative PIN family toxin of toxin-antitoxin system